MRFDCTDVMPVSMIQVRPLDPATFYAGGPVGYADYPVYAINRVDTASYQPVPR